MEILKKLTVRGIVGDVAKIAKELNDKEGLKNGEVLLLCRILGQANSMKTGSSEYGDYVEFKGQFKGTSMVSETSGRTVGSGKCFLPEIAADMLAAQLGNEDATAVQFAFDIQIVGNEKAATGFEYTVTPLIEEEEADPLAALEARVTKALPNAE